MISFENPAEDYVLDASHFRVTELRIVRVSEPQTTIYTEAGTHTVYTLTCPRLKYVFIQKVSTWFTNTKSYAEVERTPPQTVAGLYSYAASVSKITLPALIAGANAMDPATAPVSDWIVTKHEMNMVEDGIYRVDITLQAYSDYIWNRSAYRKVPVPAAEDITDMSPYK